MNERGELLFDASRFKLTARKSDSKLNVQSFSVNTQKGGISMEDKVDGMPQDNNNNREQGTQGGKQIPQTPSATEQLFSALDSALVKDPQGQPWNREAQDEVAKRVAEIVRNGEPQATREAKKAVAQISLEQQRTASLEAGQLDEAASEDEVISLVTDGEATTEAVEDKKEVVLSSDDSSEEPPDENGETATGDDEDENTDPVMSKKELLVGRLGMDMRKEGKKIGKTVRSEQRIHELLNLDGVEFLERFKEVMIETYGTEDHEVDTAPELEEAVSMQNIFLTVEKRDQVFEALFRNLESFNEETVRAMLESGGDDLVRTLSAETKNSDDYARRIDEILKTSVQLKDDLSKLFGEIRADAAGVDSGADKDFDKRNEDDDVSVDVSRGSGGGDRKPPVDLGDLFEGGDPDDIDPSVERDVSKKPDNWFDGLLDSVMKINDPNKLKVYMQQQGLGQKIKLIENEYFDATKTKTWGQVYVEMLGKKTIEDIRKDAESFFGKLKDKITTKAEKEDREKKPESFEELLELIMSKETDDYQTGGIRELITENGEIRPENFHAWVRKKANFWSNFNPDSQVELFSQINIPMMYSPITFQEMVTNPQYFRRRERKILLDEDGNQKRDRYQNIVEYADITHTDAHYDKMKGIIMNDIFYYNMSRNFSVSYIENQEKDGELPGIVAQILSKNHFTKEGFQTVFSLPSTILADVAQEKEGDDENFLTGEAVALAYNIYDNISDNEALRSLLGEDDNLLLSKTYIHSDFGSQTLSAVDNVTFDMVGGDIRNIRELASIKSVDGKDIKFSAEISKEAAASASGDKLVFDDDWYDANGVLINEQWANSQFADYINIFNEQKKDPRIVTQLRERVRQTLAFKMMPRLEGTDTHERLERVALKKITLRESQKEEGARLTKERVSEEAAFEAKKQLLKFAYEEAVHAEEVSFSMLKWTGTAAKNDTTATGFDAGTKFFETAAQRIRQGDENRGGGAVGNIKDIMINKRLLAPVMIGMKTTTGLTPKEFSEKIAKNIGKRRKIDEKGNEVTTRSVKDDIVFGNNAMRDYGGNHYARGGGSYESLAGANPLDFSKLVTFDPNKGAVVNKQGVIKELNEGLLKPERYRIATYDGIDYRKVFRFLDITKISGKEKMKTVTINGKVKKFRPIDYEDLTMAEAMYGAQVFDRAFRKGDGTVDVDKVQDKRSSFWKEVVSVRLGAYLAQHRDHHDSAESWSTGRVEAFFEALKSVPADIEADEKDFWKSHAKKKFFNEELERHIRKLSHTEIWRLYGLTLGGDITGGLLSGLLAAAKEILGETIK